MVSIPVPTAARGQLKVRDYTDVDLREIKLETNDPVALGNFAPDSPQEGADLTFVTRYEANDVLTCAFGHKHKRGFVLEDDLGQRYLIGRDCARSHYDLDWDTSVRTFEAHIERQKSLQWLHKISSTILSLDKDILAILDHPSVAAFDKLRRVVRGLPAPVFAALQAAAGRSDQMLWGTYKERNLAEERKRKEKARLRFDAAKSSRDKDHAKRDLIESQKPVFDSKFVSVMRVPAPTLFLQKQKMRERLEAFGRRLKSTAETLSSDQIFNHPKLVSRSITTAATEFDETLAEIDEAIAIFAAPTLDRLEQWLAAEEFTSIKVTRISNGLILQNQGDDPIAFERPSTLQSVRMNLHHKLRFD